MQGKPRVGISSCLLGHLVRYDGGHKREPLLLKKFGKLMEWIPVRLETILTPLRRHAGYHCAALLQNQLDILVNRESRRR